jgi:hypothetical protein
MKRSQVIEHLTNLLMRLSPEPFSDAAHILAELESMGMAPPEIKEPCETHYINAIGQLQRGEDSFVFVRRWEDET